MYALTLNVNVFKISFFKKQIEFFFLRIEFTGLMASCGEIEKLHKYLTWSPTQSVVNLKKECAQTEWISPPFFSDRWWESALGHFVPGALPGYSWNVTVSRQDGNGVRKQLVRELAGIHARCRVGGSGKDADKPRPTQYYYVLLSLGQAPWLRPPLYIVWELQQPQRLPWELAELYKHLAERHPSPFTLLWECKQFQRAGKLELCRALL